MTSRGFGLDQERCQRPACVVMYQVSGLSFLRAIRSAAPVIVYFARILTFPVKPTFKIEADGGHWDLSVLEKMPLAQADLGYTIAPS